jgi:hypothetical protein
VPSLREIVRARVKDLHANKFSDSISQLRQLSVADMSSFTRRGAPNVCQLKSLQRVHQLSVIVIKCGSNVNPSAGHIHSVHGTSKSTTKGRDKQRHSALCYFRSMPCD